MTPTLYGIANCDTVRTARGWLDARGIAFVFHDYRKAGVDSERLARWADRVGWEALLNRRGTTFRNLPEALKADMDRDRALAIMAAQPACIRRPVLEHADGADGLLVGFAPDAWAARLA